MDALFIINSKSKEILLFKEFKENLITIADIRSIVEKFHVEGAELNQHKDVMYNEELFLRAALCFISRFIFNFGMLIKQLLLAPTGMHSLLSSLICKHDMSILSSKGIILSRSLLYLSLSSM